MGPGEVRGKLAKKEPRISPIVQAIAWAEARSTAEVRVHISRRWFDKDPFGHASEIFSRFGMARTMSRNAVLFYFNQRLRRFAIVADTGADAALGKAYWAGLGASLREDLLSTHFENAIAIAVRTLGISLSDHFPKEKD